VSVLVRPKASRHGSTQAPAERFAKGVAGAEIFRQLAPGWDKRVLVVGAELEQPELGLSAADREELCELFASSSRLTASRL
jgi:hypothetical protein